MRALNFTLMLLIVTLVAGVFALRYIDKDVEQDRSEDLLNTSTKTFQMNVNGNSSNSPELVLSEDDMRIQRAKEVYRELKEKGAFKSSNKHIKTSKRIDNKIKKEEEIRDFHLSLTNHHEINIKKRIRMDESVFSDRQFKFNKLESEAIGRKEVYNIKVFEFPVSSKDLWNAMDLRFREGKSVGDISFEVPYINSSGIIKSLVINKCERNSSGYYCSLEDYTASIKEHGDELFIDINPAYTAVGGEIPYTRLVIAGKEVATYNYLDEDFNKINVQLPRNIRY